jgi:HlyD family secretion protein
MSTTIADHHRRSIRRRSLRTLTAFAALAALAQTAFAADDADAVKGPAVSVLKASKACFPEIVEASGFLIPRDEVSIRPDRPGAKVIDVMAEAGDVVGSNQALARVATEQGASTISAPVAGLVSSSTAVIGSPASAKGEALFTVVTRGEFDLVAQVSTGNLGKLSVDQPATVRIVGALDEMQGKVRRVSATVEPNSQLGNVFVAISTSKRLLGNASGRAMIKTGESCGISVPLTAVIYSPAGTIIQVVRHQTVETKRVEVGLMNGGNVEIREGLQEGETVVARAGALLREGDSVRPILAANAAAK